MTTIQLRAILCGPTKRFSMPLGTLKDRLGSPSAIRVLRKWCKRTGGDVVLMTYDVDDGSIDVFCPIEIINGVETIVDGWFGPSVIKTKEHKERPSGRPPVGLDHQLGLYRSPSPAESPTTKPQSNWRSGDQLSFADQRSDDHLGPTV